MPVVPLGESPIANKISKIKRASTELSSLLKSSKPLKKKKRASKDKENPSILRRSKDGSIQKKKKKKKVVLNSTKVDTAKKTVLVKTKKTSNGKKKNATKQFESLAPTSTDISNAAIEVVTSAAVKRVATRMGIACISNEASKCSSRFFLLFYTNDLCSLCHKTVYHGNDNPVSASRKIFRTLHIINPNHSLRESCLCYGNC